MPTDADPDTEADLAALREHFLRAQTTKLGFPGADDIDFSPLAAFNDIELNNIGDPDTDPVFAHHTKVQEREAIRFFADLFHAPLAGRWGIVTNGSTDAIRLGLRIGRDRYPDAMAYYSAAAHYKVPDVFADLRMPAVPVPARTDGELDYQALHAAVAAHPGRPAVILATAGTTMTEAVDDLDVMTAVLNRLGVTDRYIHVDAALAGVPLALLPDDLRPRFDFTHGANSLSFSTHKFLATRWPGALFLSTGSTSDPTTRISYTGAADAGPTGSRNAHTALRLWYCMRTLGQDGLRRRAEESRDIAEYAVQRLKDIGWPAWRQHPQAFTVVLRTPPAAVARAWQLSTGDDGWSKIIGLPGRRDQVDRFVLDLQASQSGADRRTAGVPAGRDTISAVAV
jgi:histidine decarboxylase